MHLAEYTGNGIRIAVIDSGVHAGHPHVGGVGGGFAIGEDGMLTDDFVDRLGHGTAVTAAIREKVPDADILIVKVFWRALATDVGTLVRAIEEAAAREVDVINLSLGTADPRHHAALAGAVATARARGALVVAAHDDGGVRWLPGCLEDVVAVRADWTCARDEYTVAVVDDRPVLVTSAYPRDRPDVPRELNLNGISFAVANAAGFVARALEASPRVSPAQLFTLLEKEAGGRRSPVER